PLGMDLDRYRMTVSEANALKRQARGTLGQVALSKVRPARGKPYGQSIARALQSFYAHLGDSIDSRLSPELGRDVVRTCIAIGRRAGVEVEAARPVPAATAVATASSPGAAATGLADRPGILVLGATGFIGQELARQLVARGQAIRVLVRNPSRLPSDLRGGRVEIVVGDLARDADIRAALAGVRVVYHLARPHVRTW